jgi:hypothetical protein
MIFLKNQCYDRIFAQFIFVFSQKRQLFPPIFGENVYKIITSVPGFQLILASSGIAVGENPRLLGRHARIDTWIRWLCTTHSEGSDSNQGRLAIHRGSHRTCGQCYDNESYNFRQFFANCRQKLPLSLNLMLWSFCRHIT